MKLLKAFKFLKWIEQIKKFAQSLETFLSYADMFLIDMKNIWGVKKEDSNVQVVNNDLKSPIDGI
jgi:hypothetical protein